MTMYCSHCYQEIQETLFCCPACGTEIDKAGGIDDTTLGQFLSARKDTLDILETIIDELEIYGKLQAASSLVSSGANIASALLWMFVPDKPVTEVMDAVSSGLNIANSGVALLSAWKENGLLEKANKVCELDDMISSRLDSVVPAVSELIKSTFTVKIIYAKVKELNTVYRSGNLQKYSYKPKKTELCVSVLGNVYSFIDRSKQLCKGEYSLAAERLKAEREELLADYKIILLAPKDVLDMKWKKTSM